jgi:hypothetical protein
VRARLTKCDALCSRLKRHVSFMRDEEISDARGQVVALAKAMLAGHLPCIEGVYQICRLRSRIEGIAHRDSDFDAFGVIESETDALPLQAQRHLWSKLSLTVRAQEPMPSFVHIADERDAAAIWRSGLKIPRARLRSSQSDTPVGVFAMPVFPHFLLSHQWVRELKRRGHRTAIGVYFKVPAQEGVWAGFYNQPKQQMTAGHATSALRGMQDFGFEVIIPRSISAGDITSVRILPQKLGWRFFPDAHRRGIFCGCELLHAGRDSITQDPRAL